MRIGSYSKVLCDSFQLYDESPLECLEFENSSTRLKQAMIGNYCRDFDKYQELQWSFYFLLKKHFKPLKLTEDCFEPNVLFDLGFKFMRISLKNWVETHVRSARIALLNSVRLPYVKAETHWFVWCWLWAQRLTSMFVNCQKIPHVFDYFLVSYCSSFLWSSSIFSSFF